LRKTNTLETDVNSIFFNAIAAVTIAATAQPSLAQDQPAVDAPVNVASCSVVPAAGIAPSGDDPIPLPSNGATVWISFQNRSSRPITDVAFVLERAGSAVTIVDRGRFSSGVPIRHTLGPFADLQGDETCALYSVRFDDGIVWQRP
jgi:hypothetical protein